MNRIKAHTTIVYKKDPEKGERGAASRGPSPFDNTIGTKYCQGKAGELFYDLRFYSGVVYRCKLSYEVVSTSATPLSDNVHWEPFSIQDFVANKTQFIGDENGGWLIDNGVFKYVESDGTVKTTFDRYGSIIAGGGNFTVDKNGIIAAMAGIFSGFLQMPFIDVRTAYPSVTNAYFSLTKTYCNLYVDLNDFPTLYNGSVYFNITFSSTFNGVIYNFFINPLLVKMNACVRFHIMNHTARFIDPEDKTSGIYNGDMTSFDVDFGFIQMVAVPDGPNSGYIRWLILQKTCNIYNRVR